MFPAPLTSFAPTYMASSDRISYAVSCTPKAGTMSVYAGATSETSERYA